MTKTTLVFLVSIWTIGAFFAWLSMEKMTPKSSIVTDHTILCNNWGGTFVIEDKHIFCYKDGAEDFLFNIDLN